MAISLTLYALGCALSALAFRSMFPRMLAGDAWLWLSAFWPLAWMAVFFTVIRRRAVSGSEALSGVGVCVRASANLLAICIAACLALLLALGVFELFTG